ncbi:artemin [Aplochiton taeniatus]
MRSFLKLVVLLLCVQRGDGHWLRSLLEQKEVVASSQSGSPEKEAGEGDTQREGSGARDPVGRAPPLPVPVRSRRSASASASSSASACSLRSLLLQVRDLGLGYDSDETVLFKYCGGSCPRVRSNHDLTLSNLLLRGALPHSVSGEAWRNTPRCRPSHHEDLAFLDNSHRWHKVEKLSAAGCSCVG